MSSAAPAAVSAASAPRSPFARFFYMQVGSFVALLVYFIYRARAGDSAEGVRHALLVALVVETAYVVVAACRGELKYADYCLAAVFALGTLLVYANVEPAVFLFQHYSPAIVFGTFGLMAVVPLLLGRETFTYYYARRQTPRWRQKLPTFHRINRLMAAFWTVIFFTAAGLAAAAPHDRRFTALYPYLLIFVVGLPARLWCTPLYLRLFPPALPRAVEPLIMGMPSAFDAAAACDANASIQFHVRGAHAGDYFLRIAHGACESFEGVTPAPDLIIDTPDTIWVQIVHGELDRVHALAQGLYRVEGDLAMLARMATWFRPRAESTSGKYAKFGEPSLVTKTGPRDSAEPQARRRP